MMVRSRPHECGGTAHQAGGRTVAPSVDASAIDSTNSQNCVERTIVYGIDEASISSSWATFARM